MALSIGIVGLPNVGKSTLFTALTKKGGLAANYPFATIDPNVGIVDVPDSRLQKLADIVHPGRIVPAAVGALIALRALRRRRPVSPMAAARNLTWARAASADGIASRSGAKPSAGTSGISTGSPSTSSGPPVYTG